MGQYYINQLETDYPSKKNMADSIAVLGVGSFLNHARNQLNATVNIYHDGTYRFTTINSNNKRPRKFD